MNNKFKDLQGGLFLEVTKADVGEGAGNFMKAGGDIMAWADPFFPDPSIPQSVKDVLHLTIQCLSVICCCEKRLQHILQKERD